MAGWANWKPGWANEKIFSALCAEFCPPPWPETLPVPLATGDYNESAEACHADTHSREHVYPPVVSPRTRTLLSCRQEVLLIRTLLSCHLEMLLIHTRENTLEPPRGAVVWRTENVNNDLKVLYFWMSSQISPLLFLKSCQDLIVRKWLGKKNIPCDHPAT